MSAIMKRLIESVKMELKNELSLFRAETRAQFQEIEAHFEQVNARSEQVDTRLEQIDARFSRVDEQLRALMIEQARLRGDVGNMVTRAEFQAGIGLILSRFDAFTGKWNDNDYRLAKHGERLNDHEARLARIEAPRP